MLVPIDTRTTPPAVRAPQIKSNSSSKDYRRKVPEQTSKSSPASIQDVRTPSRCGLRDNKPTVFADYRSEADDAINRIPTLLNRISIRDFRAKFDFESYNSQRYPPIQITRNNGFINTEEISIIGAHQDSQNYADPEADAWKTPHQGDGSGSMTILESYRVLSADFNPKRTVKFRWYAARNSASSAHKRDVVAMSQARARELGTKEVIGIITDKDWTDEGLSNLNQKLVETYLDIPWVDVSPAPLLPSFVLIISLNRRNVTKSAAPPVVDQSRIPQFLQFRCALPFFTLPPYPDPFLNSPPPTWTPTPTYKESIYEEWVSPAPLKFVVKKLTTHPPSHTDISEKFSFDHTLEFSKLAVSFAVELGGWEMGNGKMLM
ncbi:hypothetical protein V5O48_000213 [Marasmius crinis-equi]|uniref:Peptide hydrolase n=1 Tax=Marasmius crinis-equi TaxID=585013 RepID=A0ABR3G1X1_9AGAR